MFNQVMRQYVQQVSKILQRAHNRRQGRLTAAQQKGVAYYRAAIDTLQVLIDQPKPAWVDLQFEKQSNLRF